MQSNPGGGPALRPFNLNPANEPVSEFLVRRERELTQQIDALRGQIAPKEQEREQIRTAMRALGLLTASPLASVLATALSDGSIPAIAPNNSGHTPPSLGELLNPTLTIKQMILHALIDHFREGATPSELSGYIKVAYGREVDRNSVSPQLARLREEGLVVQPDGPPVLPGRWIIMPISDEEVGREIEARGLMGKITTERMRAFLLKERVGR